MKSKYDYLSKEFLYDEHWNKNKTLHQIAKENKVSTGSIKYIYKNLGIKTRSRAETNKLLFEINLENNILEDLYLKKKLRLKDIANKFNVCQTVIFNRLKKLNIKFRKFGRTPWNKGNEQKYYCIDCNKEVTRKTSKRCVSCRTKHFSETYKHSDDIKSKLSLLHGGNGKPYSNADYSAEFNSSLKYKIRERDNFKCALCGLSEKECLNRYNRVLDVHHIDYNKKNHEERNLITLCRECHKKTNYNREYWHEVFK